MQNFLVYTGCAVKVSHTLIQNKAPKKWKFWKMPITTFHEAEVNYLSFEFCPDRLKIVARTSILLKEVKNGSFPYILWAAPPFEKQLLSNRFHFEAS